MTMKLNERGNDIESFLFDETITIDIVLNERLEAVNEDVLRAFKEYEIVSPPYRNYQINYFYSSSRP